MCQPQAQYRLHRQYQHHQVCPPRQGSETLILTCANSVFRSFIQLQVRCLHRRQYQYH